MLSLARTLGRLRLESPSQLNNRQPKAELTSTLPISRPWSRRTSQIHDKRLIHTARSALASGTKFSPEKHLPKLKPKGTTNTVKLNPLTEILYQAASFDNISITTNEGSSDGSTTTIESSSLSLTQILGKKSRRLNSSMDGPIRAKPNVESELLFHPLDEVVVINPDQFLKDHPHLASETAVTIEEFASVANRLGLSKSAGIVAAISGGPDSMSMALLAAQFCSEHSIPLLCVTIDHALRPEAPAEALVTQGWLHQLGIPHVIIRVDWHGAIPTHGIQVKARDARYEAVTNVALQLQQRMIASRENPNTEAIPDSFRASSTVRPHSTAAADATPVHILMAHTADDNIETFWLRMAGCSGSYGLAGIAQTRVLERGVTLVRPLLEFSKNRLYATLINNNQPWASDPTNAKLLYRRNQIRHTLSTLYNGADADENVPASAKGAVSVGELQSLMSNFSRSRRFLDSLTHRFCKQYVGVSKRYGYVVVPTLALLHLPEILALRILQTVLSHVSGIGSPVRLKSLKACYAKIREHSKEIDDTPASSGASPTLRPSSARPMPPICLHHCIIAQSRHKLTISMQNVPNAPAILVGDQQPLPPYRADFALPLGSRTHWLDTWLITFQLNPKIVSPDQTIRELPANLYVRQLQDYDLPALRRLDDWGQLSTKLTKPILMSLPVLVDDHSRIVHFPFASGIESIPESKLMQELLAPLSVRQKVHLLASLRVECSPKHSMLSPPASTFVGVQQTEPSL